MSERQREREGEKERDLKELNTTEVVVILNVEHFIL